MSNPTIIQNNRNRAADGQLVERTDDPAAASPRPAVPRQLAGAYLVYPTRYRDAGALERQLASVRMYANSIGAILVDVWDDPKRHRNSHVNWGLLQMLRCVKAGLLDVIILQDLDLGSRKRTLAFTKSRVGSNPSRIEIHSNGGVKWSAIQADVAAAFGGNADIARARSRTNLFV